MNIVNYDNFCSNKLTEFKIMPHQIVPGQHLAKPETRGLLIYYEIGSGKSLTAILAIKEIQEKNPESFKQIYLVSPEIITKNMILEIEKFGFTVSGIKKIDYMTGSYEDVIDENFEDSIVLMDEVHLFNNEILKKSRKAMTIFNKIKKTMKIKVITMSGTPIYNTPFDASLLVNLLTVKDSFTRSGEEFEKRYTNTFDYELYRVGEFREFFKGKVVYFKGFAGTDLIPTNNGLEIIEEKVDEETSNNVYSSRTPELDIIEAKFPFLLKRLKTLEKGTGNIFIYCKYPEINLKLYDYLKKEGNYTSWKDESGSGRYKIANINRKNFNSLIPKFNEGGIKFIIGSEEISAGVTLMNCRYCFILDVPQLYGQLEQIQGRIMRLCSHSGLRKDKRNVTFFLIFLKYYNDTPSSDYINFEQIKTYNNIIVDTLKYIKEADIISG